MQFTRALVGAVIGGAVGAAMLVAAYFLFGSEHTALAIVVALLVGVGVRMMVTTRGHASYVRGALTAVLAIAAFMVGKFVVAEIASRQIVTFAQQPVRASLPPAPAGEASDEQGAAEESPATEEQGTAAESAATDAQAATEEQASASSEALGEQAGEMTLQQREVAGESVQLRAEGPVRRPPRAQYAFSTWDFIWLSVAALVAYELGRGSGTSLPVDPHAANAPASV
jgi:hypothetical protein